MHQDTIETEPLHSTNTAIHQNPNLVFVKDEATGKVRAKLRSTFHTGGSRDAIPKFCPEAAKRRVEARKQRRALKAIEHG